MSSMHYVGLDVHKSVIAYCVKTRAGRLRGQGMIPATREGLDAWLAERSQPWVGAMEATLFTGWIYDYLAPHARTLKVAHPLMLRAIACSKKKSDRVDAEKIADLLRADLLPECYMAPTDIRELRRVLRYRNLLVREAVRMKNKTGGLFMEVGVPFERKRLHGRRYFADFLSRLEDVPVSVKEMARHSHEFAGLFTRLQRQLLSALREAPLIRERVALLMTIPGVGEVNALTWALEIGDPHRFSNRGQVISYCGLCGAHKESAGKVQRTPLSKQRNKHLQQMLIEAAKLAPNWNERLAAIHARELERGNRNRATLEVARRLASLLWAIDKSGEPYDPQQNADPTWGASRP